MGIGHPYAINKGGLWVPSLCLYDTRELASNYNRILIEGDDHLDFIFLGGENEAVNERVKSTREEVKNYLSKALGIK